MQQSVCIRCLLKAGNPNAGVKGRETEIRIWACGDRSCITGFSGKLKPGITGGTPVSLLMNNAGDDVRLVTYTYYEDGIEHGQCVTM